MSADLTPEEEERWLIDRERGGWQFATERFLAARAQAAPLTAEAIDALGYADTYLAWGQQDEVAEALQALAHAVRARVGRTCQVDLPSLLAQHRLYGEDGDDQYECGCGAVSPPEALEEDFGELLWHEAHQAEVIARAQATAAPSVGAEVRALVTTWEGRAARYEGEYQGQNAWAFGRAYRRAARDLRAALGGDPDHRHGRQG